MQVVTKVEGACRSLITFNGHRFIYASGDDGTVKVIDGATCKTSSNLRNDRGSVKLQMVRNGTRMIFLHEDETTLEWRNIKTDGKCPVAGRGKLYDKATHLAASVCSRTIVASHPGGHIIPYTFQEGLKNITSGPKTTYPQAEIQCLGMVGEVPCYLVVGWRDRASVMQMCGEGGHMSFIGDIRVGRKFVQVASTTSNTIYAITDDSRIVKSEIVEVPNDEGHRVELGNTNMTRIPGDPALVCIAVSPCGKYVAVGAHYSTYGAIMLYDDQMNPLAMFDTNSEPLSLSFFVEEVVEGDELEKYTSLFSGHFNGQVIRWDFSRQLWWLGRLMAPPRIHNQVTETNYDDGVQQRAIDL